MAISDINTLAESAKCFRCLSHWQRLQIQTYIMAYAAGVTDLDEVSEGARCLNCLSALQLQQLKVHLLTVIDPTVGQDADALMEQSACYIHCPSQELLESIDTYLLVNDPSGPGITDPGLIAEAAACFGCVSEDQLLAMQVYSLIILAGLDPTDIDVINGLIDDAIWIGGIPGGPITGITTTTIVVVEDDGGIGGGGVVPCTIGSAPTVANLVYDVDNLLFSFDATGCACDATFDWVVYGTNNADGSGALELTTYADTGTTGQSVSETINVPIPVVYGYYYVTMRCGAEESTRSAIVDGDASCGTATTVIEVTGAGDADANGYYVTTDGTTFTNADSLYTIEFDPNSQPVAGDAYLLNDLGIPLYYLPSTECFPCGEWLLYPAGSPTAPAPTMAWSNELPPDQLTGLAVWYDASDSSTLLDAGNNPVGANGDITTWTDKSGNGRNATTQTATKPKRRVASQNGLDVVEFGNGGTTGMTSSHSINGLDNITVFAVIKSTTQVGFSSVLRWQNFDGQFFVPAYMANATNYQYVASAVDNTVSNVRPSGGFLAGRYNVFACVRQRNSSTGLKTFHNGVLVDTNATVDSAFGNRTLGIGYAEWNGSEGTVGMVGELVVYDAALTTVQIEQVSNYLVNKWAAQDDVTSITAPTDIAGLRVWFDASDATTLLDNSNNPVAADGDIYTWQDKSGNGRNATQNTATKAKRRTAVKNSLDVVELGVGAATTGLVSTDDLSGTDDISIFYVAKSNSGDVTGFRSLVRYQNIDGQYLSMTYPTGSLQFSLLSSDGNLGIGVPRFSQLGTDWAVLGTTRQKNTSLGLRTYMNSVFREGLQSANTALPSRTLALGYAQWNAAEGSRAYVGEIIIYSSALTESQRLGVLAYLRNKWGIS